MSFRFIHASDLHIGRKFANIPQPPDGNIRGRLMEARHGALVRLAEAARQHEASHILLAGDTFDTASPSPALIRQAMAAMGEDAAITWWLLPGNHDNRMQPCCPAPSPIGPGPVTRRTCWSAWPVVRGIFASVSRTVA